MNSEDFTELAKLIDAPWLADEYKEILKDVIRRGIKIMPKAMDFLEKEFEEEQ